MTNGKIDAGGTSTLVITLLNPGTSPSDLIAPLTDVFPAGVVASSIATTTCGGSVTTDALGSSVELTGGSIPPGGSCTVTVDVTSDVAGTHWNTLEAGALQTTSGTNAAEATASLTVVELI